MKRLMYLVVPLLLTGCAAAVPWNAQNYAGITHTKVTFSQVYDTAKDGGQTYRENVPSVIDVYDGKEKQSVSMNADISKGTVAYNAGGVAAFPGQATRADVETKVTESLKNLGVQIAPEVMKALVDIVTKFVGIP